MRRPFQGQYTACMLEVPATIRSSAKEKSPRQWEIYTFWFVSRVNYYYSKRGNKPCTCQSFSPAELTKILHEPRGLLHSVQRLAQPPRRDADSDRRPPGMEAVNDLVMDPPFHTNRFHSRQKQPVSHFPNGSRLRTSRRVPCLCRECKSLISQVGNGESQAA